MSFVYFVGEIYAEGYTTELGYYTDIFYCRRVYKRVHVSTSGTYGVGCLIALI